jgi:CspA family cold shock protein
MRLTGTIKFFNAERGYGFLKPDWGARDVFVHVSGIKVAPEALTEGARVTYDEGVDPRGRAYANNVKLDDAPVSFGKAI